MSTATKSGSVTPENLSSVSWHSLSKEDAVSLLDSRLTSGLSSSQVQKRLKKFGTNELEGQQKKSLLSRFFEQFKDFMIIILILAAIVSFGVSYMQGEADFIDPIIIFAIIILNALLGVIQEARAEKSLDALKKLSAPNARVLRNGEEKFIPSKDLVPGDIIFLETGNYVPADARLIQSVNLKIDESSLTGESHPVEKNSDVTLKSDTILGDRINLVFSTGIVTYGHGTAVVTGTGMHTEVGHIARMILTNEVPQTPLQKRLDQTGKILGIAALLICVIIFILGTIQGRPPFDMFMTSVSLAVAAIPEGLPAIVTIMLSLGVQRMAKNNAVIRRLPAVETLGSATVICSDKTGTLTQNKMTVTKIAGKRGFEKNDSRLAKDILYLAAQCNDAKIQVHKKKIELLGEPTETALTLAAFQCGIDKTKLDLMQKRIYEIPFDSTRKMMTTVHPYQSEFGYLTLSEKPAYLSITKGAPDVLLNQCNFIYHNNNVLTLTPHDRKRIADINSSMAKEALRVIAVAFKTQSNFKIPSSASKKETVNTQLESNLVFAGLIGMIDPPRPEVKNAVFTCLRAGIKPVMITGDHISTACAIGTDLGIIENEKEALSGQAINKMSDQELSRNIGKYGVFARVSPEHKVRIVKAFQKNGEIVAMTGDGVNDAPALKNADIGCAMGITGTDVAKNASDMILTDDNFATIVSAVKEGRGIYDNIKKSIHFLLSSNIGEIITIFIAILYGLPSPLVAVQLLWVNLVTDSLPAISLGVEPVDKDIMKRKPVPPSQGIFAGGLGIKIIIEGMMIGALALCAYVLGLKTLPGANLTLGRTMCFAVLSMSQLFHAFNMRSEKSLFEIGMFSNFKMVLSFIVGMLLQMSVITVAPLASIFKVTVLTRTQWTIVLLLAFLPIVLIEFQKRIAKS